jgi:excisionase family DNA binding protein
MATDVELQNEILTSEEARRFLKIGRTKLWELTKSRSLPAYRVGNGRTSSLRYKRSDLLDWLEQNRVGSES